MAGDRTARALVRDGAAIRVRDRAVVAVHVGIAEAAAIVRAGARVGVAFGVQAGRDRLVAAMPAVAQFVAELVADQVFPIARKRGAGHDRALLPHPYRA